MSRILKKRIALSDTAMGWIGAAIGLIAAFILDTKEQPQKWHAAIMWTVCAFGGLISFSRERWASWRFWLLGAVCLVVHVFMMWVIFAKILTFVRFLGTLYVVLPAFIESLLLWVIIMKVERNPGQSSKRKANKAHQF